VLGPATPAQTRRRVARLLSRAGFGATVSEIDQWAAKGYEAAVESLLGFAPASTRPDDAEVVAVAAAGRYVDTDGGFLYDPLSPSQRWWLQRMATTSYPLEEKLTLYWHGHFATAYRKVMSVALMIQQNMLLRDNAGGSFRDLCKRITADPAMLIFLDGNTNVAGNPNENYGREFMELFTLGRNQGYTQRDVHEAARAFTGYTVDASGNATFNDGLHDKGLKTILGNRGRWGPLDMADLVLDHHPQGHVAAQYVARRLATFLHQPSPEPRVVEAMADAFVASGYQVKPMVRALLLSPEFADGARRTIKSPAELVAGVIKTLGLAKGTRIYDTVLPDLGLAPGNEWADASTAMGQSLFNPPNVAGWKGGVVWANTATMLARYNFASRAGQVVTDDFVAAITDGIEGKPQDVAKTWMDRLGLIELSPSTQAGLNQYLAAARAAGDTAQAIARGLLTLLIASPDYNLR